MLETVDLHKKLSKPAYTKAISELQEITGFVDQMQEPPVILGADFPQVRQQ